MTTENNTFSVEALVAKYKNFVLKHTPTAWLDDAEGELFETIADTKVDAASEEQLLVTLYKSVTGDVADERILDALKDLSEHFYKDALTAEEYNFLVEHFIEVVEHMFANRKNWISHPEDLVSYDIAKISEFIKEKADIQHGMNVYLRNVGYGDAAVLFKGCNIYGFTRIESYITHNEEENTFWAYKEKEEDRAWALTQIRFYALGITSYVMPDDGKSLPAKGSMDVVIGNAESTGKCKINGNV